MEDAIFPSDLMMGATLGSTMDFVDELLFDGCWLETTDGSEFLNHSPSTSNAFLDSPFISTALESNNGELSPGASRVSNQEEGLVPLLPGNSNLSENQGRSLANPQCRQNMIDFEKCCNQPLNHTAGGSEPIRWWIGPGPNPGPGMSVMQRLVQALMQIKDFTIDKEALVQLWVPVNRGGRRMLTTNEQPFSLNPNNWRLASYRDISVRYHFSVEENSKDIVGLPGRVFLGKVPEWTPDVRFFRSDEYLRLNYAQQCDVRGTLALPVFEQGSRTCLGVIEVVMTTQKIQYRPELECVCKALEAVNLTNSIVSSLQNLKVCSKSYEAVLPEIKKVLKCACETHKLPLGQAWVPCIQQGKEGCRHSNENYANCVSTVDDACYIGDPVIKAFHEACSEHHLLKGQGVVGEAFMTNQPCFSPDITSSKKTEYPLSHHARMFDLHGSVAIRLRCIHTGTADFVLEFFLPKDCKDTEEQRKMLNSLSIIIQQACCTLRVVTNQELVEETDSLVSEVIFPSDGIPNREQMSKVQHTETYSQENSSWTANLSEVQQGSLASKEKTSSILTEKVSDTRRLHHEDSSLKGSIERGADSIFNEASISGVTVNEGKMGGKRRIKAEKKRIKAEKKITLDVIRPYFAGSLKDAARKLGVCPTTLKRICRQHGIQRWPSRTFKKVDYSLKKLQHVMESVHGTSGSFQIGSFYSSFPELGPKPSVSTTFVTSKLGIHPNSSSMQPDVGILSSRAAISTSPSSSYSHSSSSSQSYSSERKQLLATKSLGSVDLSVTESLGDGMLKRVRSHEELHASGLGATLLPRSQRHKSSKEQSTSETVQPKGNDQTALDVDTQRVKVMYGDNNIRLRMPKQWRFKDLSEEIARRFNIDDMSRYDVKYLDDDSEWVLLTCDADLEECIDVCRSSEGTTIKLKLQASHKLVNGYSQSHGPS